MTSGGSGEEGIEGERQSPDSADRATSEAAGCARGEPAADGGQSPAVGDANAIDSSPRSEASTGSDTATPSLVDATAAWLRGEEDAFDALRDEDGDIRVSRREAMAYAGGAGLGIGSWRALHNVVLGYGVVVGTNIREQDLQTLATENLAVRWGVLPAAGGASVRTDGEQIGVYENEQFVDGVGFDDDVAAARDLDAAHGLAGAPATQLHRDVAAMRGGAVTVAPSHVEGFFERIAAGEPRPATVQALRGPVFDRPEPALVESIAGVHPGDVHRLIDGLKSGFRAHSGYDIPRYAAGSIEDNVLFGRLDLRQYFESPAGFEALVDGRNSGLFCTELVDRSIEAFHAVPATEQSVPVVAGAVYDQRHKHSYTILASAIRQDGELVLPVTAIDYTHSTLYDDLHLRWLLGEGLEAYNDRHRVTEIFWNNYASV